MAITSNVHIEKFNTHIRLNQKSSFHDFLYTQELKRPKKKCVLNWKHIAEVCTGYEHIAGNTEPLHILLLSQKHVSICTSNFFFFKKC